MLRLPSLRGGMAPRMGMPRIGRPTLAKPRLLDALRGSSLRLRTALPSQDVAPARQPHTPTMPRLLR